ncbi:hypothetical protein ACFSKS_10485 [Pseudocitrobacter faecalis]
MFLINGLEQDTLAVNDRATQFGDGCFTTARIAQGAYPFSLPISPAYSLPASV